MSSRTPPSPKNVPFRPMVAILLICLGLGGAAGWAFDQNARASVIIALAVAFIGFAVGLLEETLADEAHEENVRVILSWFRVLVVSAAFGVAIVAAGLNL